MSLRIGKKIQELLYEQAGTVGGENTMLELEQIKQNLPKLSEKLGEVGDSL